MKREKILSGLWAWLLSFCVAFGGVACVSTGFAMNLDDLPELALFCAAFTLLAAIFSSFRRGGWILLLVTACFGAVAWILGPLSRQMEALVYSVSVLYDKGYGWGVLPRWTGGTLEESAFLGLCALAVPAALGVCRAVCQRRSFFWALMPGLLPLVLCLVLLDTVPEQWCLCLLLAALALLGLTHTVRCLTPGDANRLTAMLLVPVTAAACLLFALVPPEGYSAQDVFIPQELQDWIDTLTAQGSGVGTGGTGSSNTVDLLSLTPRQEDQKTVMTVTADYTGTLYLRGRAYESYTGEAWRQSTMGSKPDDLWPQAGTGRFAIRIRTQTRHPILYFPYYTDDLAGFQGMVNGAMPNTGGITQYTMYQHEAGPLTGMDRLRLNVCLQLPGDTLISARAFLRKNGINPDGKPEEIIPAIVRLVKNAAEYDTNPSVMQGDEADFALWFLTEAERGYCIHFATAGTVLLRAAGIPARYVTGYCFSTVRGDAMKVTSEQSHAWVEYYAEDQGWTPLEFTPGMGSDYDFTEPPTETPTEPPTGGPTEPSAEPTLPTQEPTIPSATPDQNTTSPTPAPNPGMELNLRWLGRFLTVLGWTCGIVAMLWGQYALRLSLKRRRLNRGSSGTRVLRCWREVQRQAWIGGQAPPKELRRIAEKAKYSHHIPTEQELSAFGAWFRQAKEGRDRRSFPIRLALRLLFALE